MYIFKTKEDLHQYLSLRNQSVGFVPTMGALHPGHLSLITESKKENKITVCSIFVNPTQFNDIKDFEKYPITIDKDIELLLSVGADVLFLPSVKEMYPEGIDNTPTYDLGILDRILEGAHRPGHFNGVCRVVEKLLRIVSPQHLYLGAKDFQQCLVIQRLVDLLQLSVQLHICDTLRESDGLAMSSRNQRLSADERVRAATLYSCLQFIRTHAKDKDFSSLKESSVETLAAAGFKTEYLELLNTETLDLMDDFNPTKHMVLLYAGKLGEIRLIDNLKV